MAKTTKVTLVDFISKAVNKYSNRQLIIEIETEMGTMVFNRPGENELLSYVSECSRSQDDLGLVLKASKSLVYNSSSFLQNDDLQKKLDVVDPLDTVTKVFEINETVEIASKIAETFMGAEKVEEIEKEIKN